MERLIVRFRSGASGGHDIEPFFQVGHLLAEGSPEPPLDQVARYSVADLLTDRKADQRFGPWQVDQGQFPGAGACPSGRRTETVCFSGADAVFAP